MSSDTMNDSAAHSNDDNAADFVNGDDIHFQYADQHLSNRNISGRPVRATLNNPNDDYPTSRIIKQSPNGDVVVESMVEEMFSSHQPGHPAPSHNHPSQHILDVQSSLWNNASLEEQENLKNFWESLDDEHKIRLVKIDKKPIMDLFKSEARALHLDQLPLILPLSSTHRHGYPIHHPSSYSHRHPNSSTSDNSPGFAQKSSPQDTCTCKYCGRRSAVIEDELESIYDTHFDDILEFIHEVRDINDLNALPGLLFGGFHLLDAEHKLQKRLSTHQSYAQQQLHPAPAQGKAGATALEKMPSQKLPSSPKQEIAALPIHGTEGTNPPRHNDEPAKPPSWLSSRPAAEQNFLQSELLKIAKVCADVDDSVSSLQGNKQKSSAIYNSAAGQSTLQSELAKVGRTCEEKKIFHTLLDPKLFQVLENMDIDKLKKLTSASGGPDSITLSALLEKAGSLRDIIRDLHDADKMLIDKGMAFLQNMGHIFTANRVLNHDPTSGKSISEPMSANLASQLSHGLLTFAEDLLKNDGHSFLSMMESLSESRNVREELLKQSNTDLPAWIDEDDTEPASRLRNVSSDSMPGHNHAYHEDSNVEHDLEHDHQHDHHHDHDHDHEYDDEEEDDIDRDRELDELYDDHTAGDGYDQTDAYSDTESEISEEEKMQEIRRLFLIQVIKLFQARLKKAYQEKLSQDRTQMLIQELEAEENAKKERELKRLKQKEKAKEKKRLQQLAKEEERQKKEQEQLAKLEADRAKLEALRLEQKRRKEEQRLKREEEKKKRIEELKRKEEEHQRKIEAQRKREEEAKKLKEERKKRAEEERKKKEEEKKVKDALKVQRDQEREQQRLDRERGELSNHVQYALMGQSPDPSQESAPPKSSVAEPLSLDSMLPSQLANSLTEDIESLSYPQYVNPLSPEAESQAAYNVPVSLASNAAPPISLSSGSNLQNLAQGSLLYGSGLHHPTSLTMPQPVQRGNSFVTGLPWASLAALTSTQSVTQTPPGLFPTPFPGNGFSPFHAPPNEAADLYGLGQPGGAGNLPSHDSLLTGTTSNALPPSNTAAHGAWPQRKSSIWNQLNVGSVNTQSQTGMLGAGHGSAAILLLLLWSASPLNAAHPLPNAYNPASADFGGSSTPSATNSAPSQVMNDPGTELLQKAAYTAFMHLLNQQQLEFGSAPLHKLFAIVPQVAGQPNVPLQQLLNALRAPSAYPFELVHDDYGTVTHVKMGYARTNRSGIDLSHSGSILASSAPLQLYGQASPLLQRQPMQATSTLSLMPMGGQRMAPISDQGITESLIRNLDHMRVEDGDLTSPDTHTGPADLILGAEASSNPYLSSRGLWN